MAIKSISFLAARRFVFRREKKAREEEGQRDDDITEGLYYYKQLPVVCSLANKERGVFCTNLLRLARTSILRFGQRSFVLEKLCSCAVLSRPLVER